MTHLVPWQHPRKYHIYPAFRCFGYSPNESDNATVNRRTEIWLLEAAKDDASTMVTQVEDLQVVHEPTSTMT